jgi:DNA-binding response OmpR family regulator
LIADGDPGIRSLLLRLFSKWDSLLIEVEDADKVLNVVRGSKPEVVILGDDLGKSDAMEIAAQVRRGQRGTKVAVVVLSGYEAPAGRSEEEDRPYDLWVIKPFQVRTFADRVHEAFIKRWA